MTMDDTNSLLFSWKLPELIGEDTVQILKCGICLEYFDSPVVLPCGHTFCFNCLLEMGKHAKRNKPQINVHDLTIGCPNCRCPIYVIALIQRDVTLNYPMSSVIEALRSKSMPKMVDVSTNCSLSDFETNEGKKEELPVITDDIMAEIKRDIDRFTEAIHGGSIIHEAFFDIEDIRNEYNLQKQFSKISNQKAVNTQGKDKNKNNKLSSVALRDCNVEVDRTPTLTQAEVQDPAILSYFVNDSKMGGLFCSDVITNRMVCRA
ncbi:postreplication repair E3 ubiquitin-protein ligase rad18-like [Gigantopelta aegis]|uniref:postreplication repair E3 ubiquitin-protein ligase rad18-like n=1 Tax=Gigantopelta aegis TaxID=1735272 RepID=UPI001B88D3B0|nr:postreplication repair E3 ubiquitin-protein ligase rad18-like [Gigantopelta aegis]